MRLYFPLILFGILSLSDGINGFPATIDGIVPEHSSHSVYDARVLVLGQPLDYIEKRVDKKKGKGKEPAKPPTSNPLPVRPKPNPKTPKKPSGGSGGLNPQTPANLPSPPVDNRKYPIFHLGKCGEQGLGQVLSNKGAPSNTPIRKPGHVPKTPKTPKASDDAEDDDHLKPGTKKLDMCAKKVTMEFPDYPSSGAFFISDPAVKTEKKKVPAYNAKVLDPCKNDYNFGKVAFPESQNDALYTPKKLGGAQNRDHFKDQWETEHVMDAQIVKKFMQDMFESKAKKIKASMIPKKWKTTNNADGYPRSATYNQCSYLEQFWVRRWAAPNGGITAMNYLLSVYPGDNEYYDELLILPGRLNNMKNQLFSVRGSNVISKSRFEAASLNQKVDELREAILLIKYLNKPEFQKAWRQVSGRIRDRLQAIEEGANGHIRKTDDFWYKSKKEHTKSDEPALKDAPGEKYRSTGLSARWGSWIDSFVKERADKMEALILNFYQTTQADWKVAQTYIDLRKADKIRFQARMNKLATEVKQTKINRRKLAIGRPGQMQDAIPGTPDNSDSESNSDSSDQPPDSPTPNPSGQKLPVRPKPNTSS